MIDKISLILTAHRREFLSEALISICAQTDKDFELVLCLDLSVDEGLIHFVEPLFNSVCCKEKKKFGIFGNGTAGYTRNYAIAMSSGNWIAYIDGDDMIYPSAIQCMRRKMSENRMFSIFTSGMMRVKFDGKIEELPQSLTYYPPLDIYYHDPDIIGEATYFNQFQLMKKDCWEYYHYDETTNGEDIDFMLHQLTRYRYMKVAEYLYYYRDVDNSFSKTVYPTGDLTTRRYLSGYYQKLYESNISDIPIGNFSIR